MVILGHDTMKIGIVCIRQMYLHIQKTYKKNYVIPYKILRIYSEGNTIRGIVMFVVSSIPKCVSKIKYSINRKKNWQVRRIHF